MSKEKDQIKKSSQPDARKQKKRIPDYGRPPRREIGWNEDNKI